MAKEQQLLKGKDGFYVGRVLKNGELSADAYRICDKEIVTMFEDYLNRYCAFRKKDILEVCRGEQTVFEAKLHINN